MSLEIRNLVHFPWLFQLPNHSLVDWTLIVSNIDRPRYESQSRVLAIDHLAHVVITILNHNNELKKKIVDSRFQCGR